MVVHVSAKNDGDLNKKGARLLTMLNINFSRAANSTISCGLWLKSEVIRDIMVVHVSAKNEQDPIKYEEVRVLTRFSPL